MKPFSYLLLVIIGGSYFFWSSLTPIINPNDIQLSGVVKKAYLSAEPRISFEKGYVIEVSLNKSIDKPLFNQNRDYYYDIYPYVQGFNNASWDFFKGFQDGSPIGGENYSFGMNGTTALLAGKKLNELNIYKGDQYKYTNFFNGFTYQGTSFPIKMRFYLNPDNKIPDERKAYLLYSHYEKRWGKDLSWVKIIPVKVVK